MTEETYFMFAGPRPSILEPLSARERWKEKHREERMRRKGYPERQINPPVIVTRGTWQGIEFISEKKDG